LIRSGVVEHQSALGRAAVGIDTSATLHTDKVPWFGRWHGPDDVWYPVAQLNEPPRKNAARCSRRSGAARRRRSRTGRRSCSSRSRRRRPRTDLVGTIASVGAARAADVPADGAVLVARGTAARPFAALPVGTQVTLRIPLPTTGRRSPTRQLGPDARRERQADLQRGRGADARAAARARSTHGDRPARDGTIVMVAVDGRGRGWSIGITNWDLAQTLVRYGCVTGFALDSGGSTTVAFDGKVLNRPSDSYGERPVGEALVIAYTACTSRRSRRRCHRTPTASATSRR
jgi:hypothetical protein